METGSVTGISVSVAPPTKRGRLYPRYDESAGILAVESRVDRPWVYGIDIDGRVILDLDEHHLLANIDLHVPKKRWKKNLGDDEYLAASPGDLVFTSQAIETKSFSLTLQVRVDVQSERLRIEFGTGRPDRAVALSESCIALLSAGELYGFEITDFA